MSIMDRKCRNIYTKIAVATKLWDNALEKPRKAWDRQHIKEEVLPRKRDDDIVPLYLIPIYLIYKTQILVLFYPRILFRFYFSFLFFVLFYFVSK